MYSVSRKKYRFVVSKFVKLSDKLIRKSENFGWCVFLSKPSLDQTLKRKNPPYLKFFIPSVIFERGNYCKTQKEAKSPFSMHITG